MSWPHDCPACQLGRHDRHTAPRRRPKYVGSLVCLGGVICECTGDCAERHEASAARLNGTVFAPARRGG